MHAARKGEGNGKAGRYVRVRETERDTEREKHKERQRHRERETQRETETERDRVTPHAVFTYIF